MALLLSGCGGAAQAPADGAVPPGHVTVVTTAECIGDFALDGTNLYFTTPTSVMSIPKTGGSPATLSATQGSAGQLSVSGSTVYWIDTDAGSGTSALMSAPIGGGPAALRSSASRFMAASSAGFFFVTDRDVEAVASGQTSDTLLATGTFGPITADAQSVYVVDYGTTDTPTNTLKRLPAAGGTPVTLASVPSVGMGFVTDGAYVYWIDGSTSDIVRVPVGGGTPATFVPGDGQCPSSLAVDGASVYWVNGCANGGTASTVMKVPVEGGAPVTFATSSYTGGGRIAVDETSVYWWTGNCNDQQTIVKTTPK